MRLLKVSIATQRSQHTLEVIKLTILINKENQQTVTQTVEKRRQYR